MASSLLPVRSVTQLLACCLVVLLLMRTWDPLVVDADDRSMGRWWAMADGRRAMGAAIGPSVWDDDADGTGRWRALRQCRAIRGYEVVRWISGYRDGLMTLSQT